MTKVKTPKQVLHLGCGHNKMPGAVGVDINKKSQADVIHDLNIFPYPFKPNQFKLVVAQHVIEHLEDIEKVMKEIYRISQNKARVLITSCHFTSVDSFTDPTHKHFLTSRTFDYFIPGTVLYNLYSFDKIRFRKIKVSVGPAKAPGLVTRLALNLINNNLMFYEKHLAYILPVGQITFELEVIK